MRPNRFPRPSSFIFLACIALLPMPVRQAIGASAPAQPVVLDPATGGADLSKALLSRLEFEALGLQLIGVATLGGGTSCFIKQPGSAAPQTYQVGQSIGAYKVVAIQNNAVALDRDGFRFWLGLGGADANPSVEENDEPQLTLAETIDQEIFELEGVLGTDAGLDSADDVEVKAAAAKLKTRTSRFESARVVKDGWVTPRSLNSAGRSADTRMARVVAPSGNVKFAWPIAGRLSSEFGYRRHPMGGGSRMHQGIDLAAPYGTTVKASAAGVVTASGYNGALGRYVYIDHGTGFETRYGHLSARLVEKGDRVKQGQAIGREGSSGYSTGPHLHFELRKDGRPVNPLYYLGK